MTSTGTSSSSSRPADAGAPRPGGTGPLAGRTVSRIGYGAMQLERLRSDRAAAVGLVRRALDRGVDHLDTAQFYGDGFVNEVIREALRPTDDIAVVSKVGADPDPGGPVPLRPAQRPEELRASVEDNLRSLGTDRIAVVNLRRLDTGPGLRAEGKIGAIGLSSVTEDGLRRALPADIVCVQNAYSVVSRDDEDMLGLCLAEGIAWVPYFPLGGAFPAMPKVVDERAVHTVAQALGVTPAQVGLAWLLHHAPNVLLIPGTADPDHLDANLAVGAIALDESSLAALDAVESRSADVRLG
ncbi:aldo/keto reductase [Streptomyces coelicoflavus]|uniref:aldo/keto reductase n=1 Tax=Streptomyces coelicoflavus TaxID=285562 RepID=UPI003669CAAF